METPIDSQQSSQPTKATPQKKLPLKQKVEAILFAVGSRISLADITRLAKSREDAVKEALQELKKKYENPEHSLVLIEDGDFWKLAVRDHYLSVVKKIVTETELSKTVLETLAVIAFKYPIKQSELIKIRTNKAYDHLKELEAQGFISRKKHSRTNLIKLTEKFFQYFDLPEEKLKQHLADFESIAKAITQKEVELVQRKAQRTKELEDLKGTEDRIKQEIDSLDDIKIEQPKLGDLEVYGKAEQKEAESASSTEVQVYETKEEESREEIATLKEAEEEPKASSETPESAETTEQVEKQTHPTEHPSPKNQESPEEPSSGFFEEKEEQLPETHFEGIGIQPTLEQEKDIDDKVEKMLHPPKDEDEDETKMKKDESELEEELSRAKRRRHRVE